MARPSTNTVIQQKITELTKQVAHFEQCIQTAKQYIRTLECALIALQSEPFQPPKKKSREEPFISTITVYGYRPSEFIAKVFKRFPNQWLSATEIMLKAFELEGETPDKVHHHSISTTFFHALKRLEAKGIVEKQLAEKKTLWKLADIESLANHVAQFNGK